MPALKKKKTISGVAVNYKKKKSPSPYKFNEPKVKGKVIRPKKSATNPTRKVAKPKTKSNTKTKSSYGKKKVPKVSKTLTTKKGTLAKKKKKSSVRYEPPKIRIVRIISTRSMVPMVGCG